MEKRVKRHKLKTTQVLRSVRRKALPHVNKRVSERNQTKGDVISQAIWVSNIVTSLAHVTMRSSSPVYKMKWITGRHQNRRRRGKNTLSALCWHEPQVPQGRTFWCLLQMGGKLPTYHLRVVFILLISCQITANLSVVARKRGHPQNGHCFLSS